MHVPHRSLLIKQHINQTVLYLHCCRWRLAVSDEIIVPPLRPVVASAQDARLQPGLDTDGQVRGLLQGRARSRHRGDRAAGLAQRECTAPVGEGLRCWRRQKYRVRHLSGYLFSVRDF